MIAPPISQAKKALAAAIAGGGGPKLTVALYECVAEAAHEFLLEWYQPALASVRRAEGTLEGLAEELHRRIDRDPPAARTLEWLLERQSAVLAGVPTLVDGYPALRLFERLVAGDIAARLG
jgi:hypothetical protein